MNKYLSERGQQFINRDPKIGQMRALIEDGFKKVDDYLDFSVEVSVDPNDESQVATVSMGQRGVALKELIRRVADIAYYKGLKEGGIDGACWMAEKNQQRAPQPSAQELSPAPRNHVVGSQLESGPPMAEVSYRIPMVPGYDINIPTPENILGGPQKHAGGTGITELGSLRLELPAGGLDVHLHDGQKSDMVIENPDGSQTRVRRRESR